MLFVEDGRIVHYRPGPGLAASLGVFPEGVPRRRSGGLGGGDPGLEARARCRREPGRSRPVGRRPHPRAHRGNKLYQSIRYGNRRARFSPGRSRGIATRTPCSRCGCARGSKAPPGGCRRARDPVPQGGSRHQDGTQRDRGESPAVGPAASAATRFRNQVDRLEPPAVTSGPAAGPEVRILAPAKINLGLAVLGRRADGYHELRTIFQAVSLCDRIALRPARSGVRVNCPALPGLGENNLAHRAAGLFLEKTGVTGGVRIDLEKRIPAEGGLGGGSSDAAAVLLGCCRLFGCLPEPGVLHDWAAALGSDVPFFLDGGSAIGSGRGEMLEPLAPFAGTVVALIHVSAAGLSTAAVYRRLRPAALTGSTRKLTILLACWQGGDLRRLAKMLFNDLEAPAFALAPELAVVKEALYAAGAAGPCCAAAARASSGCSAATLRPNGPADGCGEESRAVGQGAFPAGASPMGRRQAVRHGSLDPAFGGSNPPAPAMRRPLQSLPREHSCDAFIRGYPLTGVIPHGVVPMGCVQSREGGETVWNARI